MRQGSATYTGVMVKTTESRPRIAVVFNPMSVSKSALSKAFSEHAEPLGYGAITWCPTTAAQDGTVVAAHRALASNPSLIVVAGGDGTLRTVVAEVHSTGIPIGIIPTGSGNLFARNLQLPVNSIKKAVKKALAGNLHKVDLAQAAFTADGHEQKHIFLVMAGFGLDAEMATETNPQLKKRAGWLAYVAPIVRSVSRNVQHEMDIRLDDGKHVTTAAHTAIVGNCGTLTANLLLLPEARVDDGLLDVVVFKPKNFGGWTQIWSRLAIGGALNKTETGKAILKAAPIMKALVYRQTTELEVDFHEPQVIQLDGDSFGEVQHVQVRVLPHALTVRA